MNFCAAYVNAKEGKLIKPYLFSDWMYLKNRDLYFEESGTYVNTLKVSEYASNEWQVKDREIIDWYLPAETEDKSEFVSLNKHACGFRSTPKKYKLVLMED